MPAAKQKNKPNESEKLPVYKVTVTQEQLEKIVEGLTLPNVAVSK